MKDIFPKSRTVEGRSSEVFHIPSLDGLRAVSILLVVLGHAIATRGFPTWLPLWALDHGRLGVQFFFAISGFLITSLLIREQQNTGRISLRLFYARRTLRIFPAFYLFLFVMALLSLLRVQELPLHDLLHAATYTMNYAGDPTWSMGHLWSLSVEEQFYFVWPSLLLLIGFRRALWAAAFVALVSPAALDAMYLLRFSAADAVYMWFPFVADSIALGCVLAGVLPFLRDQLWFNRVIRSRWGLLVPVGIVMIDCLRPHRKLFLLAEYVVNPGIAYSIARFTTFPSDAAGRLLNSKAMGFLGGLSYSLYLWQQPFLNRHVTAPWTTFPLNVLCAGVLACASYFLVERPCLRLRKRFQPTIQNRTMFGKASA